MDKPPQAIAIVDLILPPQTDMLRLVRSVVTTVSREVGFPPEEASMIEISVDEACANIIRHAYGEPAEGARTRSTMRIQICPAADHLIIRVMDSGKGLPSEGMCGVRSIEEYAAQPMPQGLGSFIIDRFMDEVTYDSPGGSGTVLLMVKHLPR